MIRRTYASENPGAPAGKLIANNMSPVAIHRVICEFTEADVEGYVFLALASMRELNNTVGKNIPNRGLL